MRKTFEKDGKTYEVSYFLGHEQDIEVNLFWDENNKLKKVTAFNDTNKIYALFTRDSDGEIITYEDYLGNWFDVSKYKSTFPFTLLLTQKTHRKPTGYIPDLKTIGEIMQYAAMVGYTFGGNTN